ncbi:hypothetical protein GYMLUDRAFT_65007 [Collybiopsis luxurians FD-317 M1]|uniref:Unplaced genomic scaffold GYMLUscaffold_125, whole genome shotgun sequence n=1 Tax=Collybiopsis luxurians FD-317 M1 TaxID=944289 RepID=A0A0D0C0I2_9AGAR|nr:hypothetical protein GYMLUDRAFT_65007 [Collybiopsis luxurians FD-317 M1]
MNLPKLDGMGGDYNLALTSNDCMPAHVDNRDALVALEKFHSRFNLVDGWRQFNDNKPGFTFRQAETRSRIDRIYLSNEFMRDSSDWDIVTPNITSDHDMVTAAIMDPIAPFIGKGRWTTPLAIIKHKGFKEEVAQELICLKTELSAVSYVRGFTNTSNKQTSWKKFKE